MNYYAKKSKKYRPFVGLDYTNRKKVLEVIPHQSVTPAEMLVMAEQGIPISADNAAAFSGEANPSWDLPLERQKFVDPADLWQAQQNIRHKVRDAYKKQKELNK